MMEPLLPGSGCAIDPAFEWCIAHEAPIVTVGKHSVCIARLGISAEGIEASPITRIYRAASQIRDDYDFHECDHSECVDIHELDDPYQNRFKRAYDTLLEGITDGAVSDQMLERARDIAAGLL